MTEPDPKYLKSDLWREHKDLDKLAMHIHKMRTTEAWRDYLYSGRVEGKRTTRYGCADITVTIKRHQTA